MLENIGKTRIRYGIIGLVIHLLLYYPFLHLANRVEPTIGGIPFLMVYLWIIYIALLIVTIVQSRAVDKEEKTNEKE